MEIDDFIDQPISHASPTALMQVDESLDRKKARELARIIVREKELDEESLLPSGDDHLSKLVNRPLLDMIRTIEKQNKDLQDIIANGSMQSDITPSEAAKALRENADILLNIKKSVSNKESSGTTFSVDVGSIFKEATVAAREAVEREVTTIEVKQKDD